MKNILFVHSSSEKYGSDKSLLNLIKQLSNGDYRIFVILPETGPLVKEIKPYAKIFFSSAGILRRKNFTFIGIFRYLFSLFGDINFIQKIIKKNDIDVVYTNTSVTLASPIAAILSRKKSIWHIREIIQSRFENIVISSFVLIFSSHVIYNSQATKNNMFFQRFKKKKFVIYNVIDTDGIFLSKKNTKRITVGMAGRINKWKGQKLFLKAAKIVHQTNPNISFEIAGDIYPGDEDIKKELLKYSHDNSMTNYVKFLGLVKNMNSFYNDLNIFVLPSTNPEPFGLVVLEAMIHELPVIATNHGGPTEILDDGIDGMLVPWNTPTDMAKAILFLSSNESVRKRMGVIARKKVLENFSTEHYLSEIKKVID